MKRESCSSMMKCELPSRVERRDSQVPTDPIEDFEQMAVLATGPDAIGIPRTALLDVVPLQNLVFCGNGPPWLLGITEYLGSWFVVVSTLTLVRGVSVAPNQSSKLALVAETGRPPLGLLIDSAIGFRDVYRSELETQSLSMTCRRTDLILGVTQDQLQLLDLARLFAEEALSREHLRSFFLVGFER